MTMKLTLTRGLKPTRLCPSEGECACKTYLSPHVKVIVPPHNGSDLPRDGYLVAVEGRAIAISQVEIDVDKDAPHREIILPRQPIESSTRQPVEVGEKTCATLGGPTSALPEETAFPPFREVLPDISDDIRWFVVNAKLLADLAASISTDGVVAIGIESGKVKSRPVLALNNTGNIGVVAPFTNDSDFTSEWRMAVARLKNAMDGKLNTDENLPSDTKPVPTKPVLGRRDSNIPVADPVAAQAVASENVAAAKAAPEIPVRVNLTHAAATPKQIAAVERAMRQMQALLAKPLPMLRKN
jgi:hypothetical protein